MNLSGELKRLLSSEFVSALEIISQKADDFGVRVFIIGGVVRDLLLGKNIYDVDLVVEGNAIEFCKFIEAENCCNIERLSPDFGTAKITLKQFKNLSLDFASTRTEKYPKKGHLPVVDKIGCTLLEDIKRRDFSVNALALSINKNDFGKLIDYTDGVKDIEKKELKILHDNSFIDDPTRIIRGLRFAYKLDFKLEDKTQILQKEYLQHFNNNDICYERIKQVVKLAFGLNSAELYNEFINSKIYKLITAAPFLKDGFCIKKAIEKNKKLIPNENIWLVYLSCCINLEDTEKLNLNSKELSIFKELNRLQHNKVEINSNYDIYNQFNNVPMESIVAYLAITQDNSAQIYIDNLMNITPAINGNDLIELGFERGRIIGQVIEKIKEEKINGNIKNKEDEFLLAKKIMSEFYN